MNFWELLSKLGSQQRLRRRMPDDAGSGGSGYCSACFDGEYPTAIPTDTRKDRFEQKLSERKRG